MSIASAAIQTTETTVCLAGAGETRAVLSVIFCNVTAADCNLTFYAIKSGGTAGNGTTVMYNITIPAGDSLLWTGGEKFILDAGDKLSALCGSNNAITSTANYYLL